MLKKKKYWFIALYGVLLAASFAVRMTADPPLASPGKKFETIRIENEPAIKFAYQETGSSVGGTLPVILVHGSPGSAEAFDGLTELLPGRRIIAIDLPGFGDSELNIPDYSILAHAKYLVAFLKKKGIGKAHFVGFSLGGGVILEAEKLNPELIESETLVSSIGVQEYELFGDYYVNHAVHGLQLVFFWSLKELTPHFGLFDSGVTEYSRNFYDTDQRPLRASLGKTNKPVLILHGKYDPLVPVEAAREHARLVPQSQYHELEENHFYIFMRPGKVSGIMMDFWQKVENGTAVTRNNARTDRLAAARKPFVYSIIPAKGPATVCFFLLIFAIAVINEDFAAVLAGVFVAQGRFGLALPILAIVLAVFMSSLFLRRIGRRKRGNAPGLIPSLLERRKSKFFGFRFQDYINRSRDPFIGFVGRAIGLGIVRAFLIGSGVYLLTRASVMSGLVENTNSALLISGAALVYVLIALVRMRITLRQK